MSGILDFLKEFDIAKILPEAGSFVAQLAGWLRLFLLAGPVVLAVLGLWYTYAPPAEANFSLGFRSKNSIRSVAAWKFAQKIAGRAFLIIGGGLAVIMLVISLFFGLMSPLAMAIVAMLCVIVEGVLIVLLHIHIDKQVQKKFDKNGNPRR